MEVEEEDSAVEEEDSAVEEEEEAMVWKKSVLAAEAEDLEDTAEE